MIRTKRTASACLALAAITAGALGSASAQAAPSKVTITSEGANIIKPNHYFQSSLYFSPGTATAKSGAALTVKDKDQTGEPHTITFVKKSEWPRKFEDFLDCGACNAILAEHAPNGEPPQGEIVPVIDKNAKGVDGPGDSYFFDPKTPAKTTISAKAGTTLYFVCAIHPWMEGKLKVTK